MRNLMKNQRLIKAASVAMKTLDTFLDGSGFIIILTDKEGCILNIIGDSTILEEANKIEMIVGTYMNKECIGANSIETAIKEDAPIQISAIEHFITEEHKWTCSAAPIHDEFDSIIGTLNLTGEKEKVHSHTLGLVIAAVNSIEGSLIIRKANSKIIEAYDYLNTMIDSIKDGIYVVGKDGRIKTINKAACSIFGVREEFILNKKVDDILPNWKNILKTLEKGDSYEDREANLNGYIKGVYHLSVTPIISDKKLIGIVVILKEIDNVINLVNKYSGFSAKYTFEDIVCESNEMKEVIEFAKVIAKSPSTVLINGESGTGKELMAQSIHNHSDRKSRSFIAVNCGAIPKSLVESELFGYVDGAFTGARKGGCPGKFELAHRGTLFLDEIGEMSLDMQVKLLRVLQEGKITRVGGEKTIDIDVRIIAATHRDLQEEVKRGTFREDLYYRLKVIPIKIPPLRDRKEDISILIRYYLRNKAMKLNKQIPRIDDNLKESMLNYHWPGNIRELENYVENLVNFNGNSSYSLYTKEINKKKDKSRIECEYIDEMFSLEEVEKVHIEKCLKKFNRNISKVAKILKISRNTLYKKIEKYKIEFEL
ncbi:sigma 54-interacting transcriptional regulator [Clostridium sediminicola]|uniref:sigma 54-interacting transcriptional regulator n=1 Tax=Clostridium sediminicola TaxID=3114879 RepID=UPI003D17568C